MIFLRNDSRLVQNLYVKARKLSPEKEGTSPSDSAEPDLHLVLLTPSPVLSLLYRGPASQIQLGLDLSSSPGHLHCEGDGASGGSRAIPEPPMSVAAALPVGQGPNLTIPVSYEKKGGRFRAGEPLTGGSLSPPRPHSLSFCLPSSYILQCLSFSFLHRSGGFHDNVLTGL